MQPLDHGYQQAEEMSATYDARITGNGIFLLSYKLHCDIFCYINEKSCSGIAKY